MKSGFIHPTAIVDAGADIGENTKIWHFSHVSSGAKVGEDTSIGQNVYIASNVSIGKNCKIQNNVSVYDNVVLEDDVFCGPSMVFTNVYNPRSAVNRKNEYLDTKVCKGATIGANATIICGITIGQFAFIGAGSVVNKDLKDYSLVVGNPCKQIGWMSQFGERLPFDLTGNGSFFCKKSNLTYILENDQVYVR